MLGFISSLKELTHTSQRYYRAVDQYGELWFVANPLKLPILVGDRVPVDISTSIPSFIAATRNAEQFKLTVQYTPSELYEDKTSA